MSNTDVLESSTDWKNIMFMMLGIALFALVYYSPPWPDVFDPLGKKFVLSREGKRRHCRISAGRNLVGV